MIASFFERFLSPETVALKGLWFAPLVLQLFNRFFGFCDFLLEILNME